jgi:hypothetical protein
MFWDSHGELVCLTVTYLLPAPFHISVLRVLHGISHLFLFATFMINTHDIDDLLTTGAPIHTVTVNEHLAGGHHIITYKALTCKYQRASQAGSSRSICAVTALNCVRLVFQLEAGEGGEETIL